MTQKENSLIKTQNKWHLETIENVFLTVNSTEAGLGNSEAKEKLLLNGRNALPVGKEATLLVSFLSQFKSPLIYVLIIAAIAVTILGDLNDGFIIFFVLFINAIIGTFQEGKANKTLRSLRDFSKGVAVVVRDGKEIEIHDEELTVGDVIVVRSGDKIPADARLISSQSFKVNESAISGESEPVMKDAAPLKKDVPLPDRKNMIYKGSLSVAGQARAVVVAVGLQTMIGGISTKLRDIESEIPLKQKVADFSKLVGLSVLAAALFVVMVGIWRGVPLKEIFFTATAISVSLIPEGLPVVITLILAKGVYRMAQKNALVKNMQAVEALGEANILAVDKTGTITKNELTVLKVLVDKKEFDVSGSGYSPKGDLLLLGNVVDPLNHPELLFAGKTACFCADAAVEFTESDSLSKVEMVKVIGDPTEAALLVFAQKTGFKKDELEAEEPKVYEIPFSFEYKFHTTLHKKGKEFLMTVVGAPEVILNKVSEIWTSEGKRNISDADRDRIEEKIKKFSKLGLRVLAFAVHNGESSVVDIENMPTLCFGGLYAMKDVLREGVAEAVGLARQNGLKTVMITGDHVGTAEAIAREAGIWQEGDMVMTGTELATLKNNELDDRIGKVSVFARVLPEHKLTIVESYKRLGLTVGMTGDGVNDALSLRAANLGLAMGMGGTEVAKESADIVLLDNNFKSIISAIHEGRAIYKTIKKVVLYLVSTSIGEFLVIAGALVLGLPLPISPTQILWLNLVTDGFLVVALAFEKESFENRKYKRDKLLFSKKDAFRAICMGAVMMLGTLLVFRGASESLHDSLATLSLTLLAMFQWFNVWNVRSERNSVFYKPFSNPYLLLAISATILLQVFAIYNPFMQNVLDTSPISLYEWGYLVLIASSIVWVEEIRKYFVRKNV